MKKVVFLSMIFVKKETLNLWKLSRGTFVNNGGCFFMLWNTLEKAVQLSKRWVPQHVHMTTLVLKKCCVG